MLFMNNNSSLDVHFNNTKVKINVWERINSNFFCLFLLLNSQPLTCDFPRVADYSKLFSDDLVNVLGLSVTLRSLSRMMSESRARSEVWEL